MGIVLPHTLHQLVAKDHAGGTLELWRQTARVDGFAQQLLFQGVFPPVPGDRLLLLQHIAIRTTPGLAQNVQDGEFWEEDSRVAFSIVGNIGGFQDVAGPAQEMTFHLTSVNGYIIPPYGRVGGRVIFNAGVAQNVAHLTICGWLIPRGNIQLALVDDTAA